MAIKYSQPQTPLKMVDEKTGDIEYIYPQTVAKQVIMEDGTRLNAYLNKLVISGGGSGSSSGGGGVSSLEDLGVLATSTELNYLIGAKANIQEQLDNRANSTHIHPMGQITGLSDALNNKVPLDRTINGKSLNSNIDLSADDIGAYSKTEIDNKLSSIGGGAADWNENDENASGYIKNRTHYSDEIVIFHDAALQKSGEGFPIHADLDVVDGETYAISVDEEKFICSARQVTINYMGQVTLSGIALGNIYLMDQTFENTGESFIFAKLDSQSASFLGCKSIVGVFTGATSINFKIAKETYHKLDMKFLPEHLLDMITVDTNDAVETNISSGINADTFCGYPIDYFVMYNVGDGDGGTGGGGNVSINLNGTEEVGEIVPINADTLKGQTAGYYKTAYNLLDNSDFRNPVNQRGATSYTSTGYSIDRWNAYNPTSVNINNGYISVIGSSNTYFRQYIEANNLYGKTFTVAVKTSDGKISFATGTYPEANPSSETLVASVDAGNFMLYFHAQTTRGAVQVKPDSGATVNLEWIALYEGEYTAETLPEYIPKGYAHELLECQRYCYVLPEIDGAYCYAGFSDSATNARITINLPVALRSIPTITLNNGSENCEVYTSSGSKKITNISVRGSDRNGLILNCTTSGLTAWSNCTARFMSMIISADL